MPLDKKQKEAAERSQSKAEGASIIAGPVSFGAVFIPGAGPFVGGAIVLLGAALNFRAKKQAKLAKDPPRDDFDEPTILGPQVFYPEVVGGTSVEEVAVRAARIQDGLGRISEAMVTAIERAWGAEIAGRPAAAEARTAEAIHFAELMSPRLTASSEALGLMQAALADYTRPVIIRAGVPPRIDAALGEDLTARLEQMGVPREDLTVSIERLLEAPVGDFDTALEEAAEADNEFARSIDTALLRNTLIEPVASTGTDTDTSSAT